jgi:uncharacterized repeat protein (TIGR03803 family)
MMTATLQHRTSRICLGAAGAALAIVVLVVFAGATPSAQARVFHTLYNFTGGKDGGTPSAGLTRDSKGNLYGTTFWNGSSGWGTVFKVDANGTETVLYNFTGGADGANPTAGLILDSKGNLYGTTEFGGSANWGTVFEIDPQGKETVLYSFAGGVADGCYPFQGVVRDKAGNLYGTTEQCGASAEGVVFEVNPQGVETVLHNFAGGASDGSSPVSGSLLRDTLGNLYGTTEMGGTAGQGVVYKLSKSRLKVLHSFAGGTKDGCFPFGSVAMDKTGNLYGTASQCGASNNGVVWKLNKKGAKTVLHSFAGGSKDGMLPEAGVILDATGNLYGNTQEGGAGGAGTVYRLSSTRRLTLLHSFTGSDGQSPLGSLTLDAKGKLYGTTTGGGTGNNGTVWKLTP